MSLQKRKESLKQDEEKMLKILFNYFKFKYVKHVDFKCDGFTHEAKYSCIYFTYFFNINGIPVRFYFIVYYDMSDRYEVRFSLGDTIVSCGGNKDKNKNANEKIYRITQSVWIYNLINKFIDNSDTICDDIYNMYKILHDTNNLNSTNTFLLCNNITRTFPRDIANLISNKILFASDASHPRCP